MLLIRVPIAIGTGSSPGEGAKKQNENECESFILIFVLPHFYSVSRSEKIKNGKTKEHRQQKVAHQINGPKKEQEATSEREKSITTS